MYRKIKPTSSKLKGVKAYKGESIEKKVFRMMTNGEPIKDGAPLTYTDRADGVQPDYDIRTDKFEYLVEGHNALAKTKRAKRDNIGKAMDSLDKQNQELNKGEAGKPENGGQSTQTT